MVFKRKLDCLSVGFDFPNIPKAPRSCRRKVLNKRTDGDTQICAMDLLASLAGKLLQESESSSVSSNAFQGTKNHENFVKQVKQEQEDKYDVKSEGSTGEIGDVNVSTWFKQGVAGTIGLGDGGLITDTCNLEGATAIGVEFPRSVCADGDLRSPSCIDMTPNGSLANNTNLGRKDDDEKLYRYPKFSNKYKTYSSPTIRRIRKSLSSKYWKQLPKDFGQTSRADVCVKALYRKRKSWQRETIYKRTRSPERSSVITSDGGLSSASVSKLSSKRETVKLSIKSFRIPELFIEVPETATVGSLKRTVMEAVSVLLGGGIRVGLLAHGKKVRDDKKTLSQSGISSVENLSNLGFTLEPCPSKDPIPLCSQDPIVQSLPERSAATSPMLDSGVPNADDVISSGTIVENNLELLPYKSDISVKALAIVPLNQKPKRTELSQRRTRRPFSVTEVESLVQAVEEIGTGRWRDVKLRSFENAGHRTYVDLKDKWKTLVHTANISPQQRRGEPVPQELLDRVLKAYGYWSQHQGKRHLKIQT